MRTQMWVALSHSSGEGDKDFGNRTGVNASAILVFVNSTIMVFFYMWIIQVICGICPGVSRVCGCVFLEAPSVLYVVLGCHLCLFSHHEIIGH